MLRFFSKFQRSSKLILLIFCAVLFLGLIMFYAFPNSTPLGNGNLRGGSADDSTVVAKVGNQEITMKEFRTQLASLAQVYSRGGNIDARIIKGMGIDKQVLDRLVEDKILLSESAALGFAGTDKEISDAVTKAFVDPETGKFVGKDEYLRSLRLRNENPEDFERGIRTSLATSKMRAYLNAGAVASDKEAEEAYKADNTKVEVVYGTIDKDKLKDKPKPSEQELQAYYDAHKGDFKATEPVRKVEYIFIPTDKVKVDVTDAELKAEYEKKKQKEPKASIIKINVPTPSDEETARRKINELAARVKGNDKSPGEDFGAVAKGNSQDPSASKGGDIGFIKRNLNNKNDWRQRAIDLTVNTIEGPFRDGNAWYLMKITGEREVPFEEMKPTLVAGAKNRSAYKKANEIADKAYELFTANKDLNKTAEAIAAEMKVKPEELIKTTPYFKKGDTLPGIGSNPTFESHVEGLKKGEIADKIGIPDGIAVPRLIDVIDGGAQLTFDQARNQIETKIGREKDLTAALDKANELIKNAKSADDLKALLTKEGFEAKTDNSNLTGIPMATLQLSQVIQKAVLATKQGEVYKAPIKTGAGTYIVFAATKRTDPDMAKFTDAEKRSYKQRVAAEKGSIAYDAFIKDTRKRYETEKKIWIDEKKIESYINGLNSQANQ